MKNTDNTTATQIVQIIKTTWANQNKIITDIFSKYSEDYYLNTIAEGRNRSIYLFGHLIVASDNLIPLLGFGDKLYPELEQAFWLNPDRTVTTLPSVSELKKYWEQLNVTITDHIDTLQPEQWLERHTKVSEEDFALDTTRNKLNAFLGRITHQNYHIGQLAFIKQPEN